MTVCFYHGDYDWYAQINEWSHGPAARPTRCDECHRTVGAGAVLHRLYQQEYEECQRCYDAECDCPKDADGDCADCKCESPEHGETFDYDRCDDCDCFLKAVRAAEEEEGCEGDETQPGPGTMVEDIRDANRLWERKKYIRKALALYPERKPYLAWLWRERLS